ncbi:MAG: transposase [Solirubrobacteraceae bacterium]
MGLAQDLIAWAKQLCLADEARAWELKRLRYRLLHQTGRLARHARRTILRLCKDWPWPGQLQTAFARLQALPPPA